MKRSLGSPWGTVFRIFRVDKYPAQTREIVINDITIYLEINTTGCYLRIKVKKFLKYKKTFSSVVLSHLDFYISEKPRKHDKYISIFKM